MDRGGHAHMPQYRVTPRLLFRGLLLIAVLTGIFGMHVLTADDGANGHGALPMTSTAGMTSGPEMASTHHPEAVTAPVPPIIAVTGFFADPGSGMEQGAMAACILFLTAAAALLLVLFRCRWMTRTVGPGTAARSALTGIRRRGPPGRYRPRVALCVIRT